MTDPIIVGLLAFLVGAIVGAAVECYCLFDKTTAMVFNENEALRAENQALKEATMERINGILRSHFAVGVERVSPKATASALNDYDGAGLS